MSSSKLFEAFISKTYVGFCAITKDHKIVEVNSSFEDATKLKDAVGRKLSDLITVEDGFEAFLEKTIHHGTASLEVSFDFHKEPFFAIANATFMPKADNESDLIAILFTEVNESKDLEHQLEERIAQEVKKNREKDEIMHQQAKLATMGEMIGNIAHQWRQPLNILALVFQDIYIKFQLGGLDSDQMEKNYEKVNNLLQYMSQTIDDFRTFFKSEDENTVFDIGTAINAVFDLVGTRFLSSNTECNINIKNSVSVTGTENGFKQVVINILNNAQEAITSKSLEKGHINIDLIKEDTNAIVTISDNGGGVSEDILNQIFEPYFTTKHKTQGTGLGLYMSKQIIEQHMAGALEVENNQEGAVFKISLPLQQR